MNFVKDKVKRGSKEIEKPQFRDNDLTNWQVKSLTINLIISGGHTVMKLVIYYTVTHCPQT